MGGQPLHWHIQLSAACPNDSSNDIALQHIKFEKSVAQGSACMKPGFQSFQRICDFWDSDLILLHLSTSEPVSLDFLP